MKVFRLIIFILVFALCLVAGINLGKKWKQAEGNTIISENTPRAIETYGGDKQRNILIIGIDQSNYENPHIEGLWLLIYYRDNPQIDLIPVFPSTLETDTLRNQTFAGNFSLALNGEPSQEFWEYLSALDILWHNFIILNEQALNEITNLLGLAPPKERGYLISWLENPVSAIRNQSYIIDEICHSFVAQHLPEDITTFVSHLTPHLVTDLSSDQIYSEWRRLKSFGNLNCNFPTLAP